MPATKEKSLEGNCIKSLKEGLNNLLIVPTFDVSSDTAKLFEYFLYLAPNIESTHSKKIPRDKHAEIFDRMMKDRHFKYQKFCWANAVIEKEFSKGCLAGDSICLKCKRFVCKKKPTKKDALEETSLECFLRHMRNSIAHGRVYMRHATNRIHFVFEDENSSKNLSARIVCIKSDLEHWRYVLSDSRNYQNA